MVGREDLPGVYQVQGKFSKICFFFKAKDQGQKQMIRDWASFLGASNRVEQAIKELDV